jgi:transcriptional regulator with XRE-family HTH domain
MTRRRTVADIEGLQSLIQWELQRQGKTQVQLAGHLGFSQKHVSQMLTGKAGISLANLFEICGYLGLSVTIDPAARGG